MGERGQCCGEGLGGGVCVSAAGGKIGCDAEAFYCSDQGGAYDEIGAAATKFLGSDLCGLELCDCLADQ